MRKANWTYIVVDVTAPTALGDETTLHIRAIDPTQTGSGVTSIADPAIIDEITISRTSAVEPPTSVPEVAVPALLVASGAAVVGGAAYLVNRRSRAGEEATPV